MSNIVVKLFAASWCPHCINFKKSWESIKLEEEKMGFSTEEYDADKHKDVIEKEGIMGFPTIKIYVDKNGKEYDGPRTTNAILKTITELKENANAHEKTNTTANTNTNNDHNNDQNVLMNGGAYYKKYRKYKAKYLRSKYN